MDKKIATRLNRVATNLSKLEMKVANMDDSALDYYLETALWSTTNYEDDDKPFDEDWDVSEFSEQARNSAREDLDNFYGLAHEYIDVGRESEAAHDFWLTRNGHGAGFWDGDWEHGDKLTEISKTFGSVDIIINDDRELDFT